MGPVTVDVTVWLPDQLVEALVDVAKSSPKLSMMTKLSLENPLPSTSTN